MAIFRTRARAVDLLGKQQIRDEVTTTQELFRNAYDADASEALLDVDTIKQRIVVWDDGDGMSKEQIEDNWLTLGTYSKYDSVNVKTRKGRIKIGEKGIGRLAISLLGDQLLLVSKTVTTGAWAILYLHWELFRNANVFLEDIEIPVESFENLNEVVSFLKNDLDILKKALIANFEKKKNVWPAQIVEKVRNDIANFKVEDEIVVYLKKIEEKRKGTTFYINNIAAANWDWSIYNAIIKEDNLARRVQRMKDVLFSFQNVIDVFEREEKFRNDSNGFTPKIRINQKNLDNQTAINQDEVKLYDYALKGVVRRGLFSGVAIIRTIQSVERIRVKKIPVTQGMFISSVADCGPIRVKWYFLEGKLINSYLPKSQFDLMKKKLETVGGIFVFRDGLRILPYGEPGNDFLGIEERRSKGAGFYLFSHRRMFGYMEISKRRNPNLIDKSSREGFIENNHYTYFRTAAENLLIWWATEFLESVDKQEGKRSQRIKKIFDEREKEKRFHEIQLSEEKNKMAYLKKLDELISNQSDNLEQKEEELKNKIKEYLLGEKEHIPQKILYKGIALQELFYTYKQMVSRTINEMDRLYIQTQSRYFHELDVVRSIEICNEQVNESKERLQVFASQLLNEIYNYIEKLTKKSAIAKETVEVLEKEVIGAIEWITVKYPNQIRKIESECICKFKNEFSEISNIFINEIEREITYNKKAIESVSQELKHYLIAFEKLKERIQSMEVLMAPDEIKKDADEILQGFIQTMNKAQEQLLNFTNDITEVQKLKVANQIITDFRNRINNMNELQSDNELIGYLQKEVFMYRDLSSIGLAAELTSHEFNYLYNTIQTNMNILYQALKPTAVFPYLEKSRQAFLSLEKLHQRISPLYKQAKYRRKELVLHHFIENVIDYFASDIRRYNITMQIDIPEKMIIKETEAVIFTPIINLVSNAIYWLMDRDVKQIHFYASDDRTKLYVHDTGPGINEKDKDRIFEPFYTRKVEGRGLGLYLSRDILEAKGYKLWLVPPEETLKQFSGACFCIDFSKAMMG